MAYGFRIELDSQDISGLVTRFEITARLDAYVREILLDLADEELYDSLDFGQIPEEPSLEVFTRVADDWVSQGKFFVEKPTYRVGIHATLTGLWGRSVTAKLHAPFAPKVTKLWGADTTFFAICQEMCDLAGVTWDSLFSEVPDFWVPAYTYQVQGLYPIEVMSRLLELAYGEDDSRSAFVTTDRAGHVCVKLLQRQPTVADFEITDPVTVSITEEPEWPEFGNRIKISASGSVGGFGVNVTTPVQCLSADGSTRARLYARVTDQDGAPVNDLPITWSTTHGLATLDSPVTNTQAVRIAGEQQRAKNFYEVDLAYPPTSIVGIWAARDASRSTDLAAAGYTVNGSTVTLTTRLAYCDQLLVIDYTCDGVAVNYATTGTVPGTEKVTADIGGNQGSVELYIGNPCQCAPSLSIRANPSSINVGESARLLAYVEIAGAPVLDGRTVFMTVDSNPSHGHIDWTQASLGQVEVQNEDTSAINEISGLTQCQLSMFPASVAGVWQVVEDSDGNKSKTGPNLYSSHTQKAVVLSQGLPTGTELLADYTALGAAVNVFSGLQPGTDRIRALLITTREERTEAEASISVSQPTGTSNDPGEPSGCCSDGLCDADEADCNAPSSQTGQYGRGVKNGSVGCWPVLSCDPCNISEMGYRLGYKNGQFGCFPASELDACTTGEADALKVYGQSQGKDGCYPATTLDPCREEGKVTCYKDGELGCYPAEECDTKYGGSGQSVACPENTRCCEHKTSGKKGCWPSDQCKSDPNRGRGHDQPWNGQKGADCKTEQGLITKCPTGQTCCKKGGKLGCHKLEECDGGGLGCYAENCQDNPTEDCLQARFGRVLQYTSEGCDCPTVCQNELDHYGTTQGYDNGSYRTIRRIVIEDHGLEEGTPAYWEKYEEVKQAALADCLTKCGDCQSAPPFTLSGSDAVTSPGGYQFSATGGVEPYSWQCSGTGVTIDGDGYVTLDDSACGAFTVTAVDKCGTTMSMTVRVTNRGEWTIVAYSQSGACKQPQVMFEYTSGQYYYTVGCCAEPASISEDDNGCCSVCVPGSGHGFCTSWVKKRWVCP